MKKIIDENNKKINLNKEENEDELILKEEKEIDTYLFYFLYIAKELDNKTFTRDTIIHNIDFIKGMPLEYLEIKIEGNNMNFKFYSNLFKKCFKKKCC
jgi:predicted PilT family ATPase